MKTTSGSFLITVFSVFLCSTFISFNIPPVQAITGFQTKYLSPTGDSLIDYNNPGRNYGSLPYFSVQSRSTDTDVGFGEITINVTDEIHTVIKFDLSSIPSGSVIQNAYLKLYTYRVDREIPCKLAVHRITSDWNERTITANNRPSDVLMGQYRYTVYGLGFLRSTGDEAWQMTDLVKKWFSGEYGNYGIRIDNRYSEEESVCKFYSKEETVSANQGKKPQLIVEYLPPLAINSASVLTDQITTTGANFYWTTSIPVLSDVYYKKVNDSTYRQISSNETVTSARVTLQNLSPNTRYMVYVKVKDAADRQMQSQTQYFTTKSITIRGISPTVSRRITPDLTVFGGSRNISVTPPSGEGTSGNTGSGNSGSSAGTAPGNNSGETVNTDEENRNNYIKIKNLRYEIGETGGTFWWDTKEEDGSAIMADIKTSGFLYVSKNSNPTLQNHEFNFGKAQGEISHTVLLKYLESATTYNYLVYSKDANGNTGTVRGTFTTQGTFEEETPAGTNPDENIQPIGNESNETEPADDSQRIDGDDLGGTDQTGESENEEDFLQQIAENQKKEDDSVNLPRLFQSAFGKNNSGGFSFTPFIIAILLIIIIFLLVTRKGKKTQEEKQSNHHKDKSLEQEIIPPKKGLGCIAKIILICLILLFVWIFGGITPLIFAPGMNPLMFFQLVREEMNKNSENSSIDKSGLRGNEIEADTSESFSKITVPKNSNLRYKAVDKTRWPEGTVGGLFKLEPSGTFSELAAITIDLKDKAVKGFALGYWHKDTKKWEYIPTIRIFGTTYKSIITHASEVGGYDFGLAGVLEYEPHFQTAAEQQEWESLKADLTKIAHDQENGFDTTVQTRLAHSKLDHIAQGIIDRCAGEKVFDNQMDYFFIWHIAQLIEATDVDEKLGTHMNRCVDLQSTRADSKYEYVIRDRQDLANDLNVKEMMQYVWKGVVTHEGYPILSGYGNTDWRTDWQVIAQTEYRADIEYGTLLKQYVPTPEGTSNNGSVTSVLLFSLKNIKEGQTFSIRGLSIGDAPGYFRNWHHDFKWRINHTSTGPQPEITDPNKHVFEMTGTLVKDNGKAGAVIKYGGLSKDQQAKIDEVSSIMRDSGIESIPAYYQELAPEMTLTIIKGLEYNE